MKEKEERKGKERKKERKEKERREGMKEGRQEGRKGKKTALDTGDNKISPPEKVVFLRGSYIKSFQKKATEWLHINDVGNAH